LELKQLILGHSALFLDGIDVLSHFLPQRVEVLFDLSLDIRRKLLVDLPLELLDFLVHIQEYILPLLVVEDVPVAGVQLPFDFRLLLRIDKLPIAALQRPKVLRVLKGILVAQLVGDISLEQLVVVHHFVDLISHQAFLLSQNFKVEILLV